MAYGDKGQRRAPALGPEKPVSRRDTSNALGAEESGEGGEGSLGRRLGPEPHPLPTSSWGPSAR